MELLKKGKNRGSEKRAEPWLARAPWSRGRAFTRHPDGRGFNPAYSSSSFVAKNFDSNHLKLIQMREIVGSIVKKKKIAKRRSMRKKEREDDSTQTKTKVELER